MVLFSSVFGSLVLFLVFILVLEVLPGLQRSENQSLVIFKTCQYFCTWGKRRPVPFLQVPAGEEGGPGGFPNLLKEEEQEEEEEEKNEDDDDE